jgi:IS5 family transposase
MAKRSKEGTWIKKGRKSYFGFKLHSMEDCDFGLIRAVETTDVSFYDTWVARIEIGLFNSIDAFI